MLAALLCALLGAPQPVVGMLVAAAFLAVGERLVRLRGLGGFDGLLVVTGGVLVVLGLVGLVIGSTPLGLHPTPWGVGLSLAAAVGLAVVARHPAPKRIAVTRGILRTGVVSAVWLSASVSIVAVAVSMSASSVERTESTPVQMSFGAIKGTSVQVVVTSPTIAGPFEMRTTAGTTDVSYPLFSVKAGRSVTTTLSLPTAGRYRITLNYPDQAQPLRTLTIDR